VDYVEDVEVKKFLAFWGKHIAVVLFLTGFAVWKWEHSLWDSFWNQLTEFVNALYEVAKPVLDKLGELWKSWSLFK
jgi:hypothetical protein